MHAHRLAAIGRSVLGQYHRFADALAIVADEAVAAPHDLAGAAVVARQEDAVRVGEVGVKLGHERRLSVAPAVDGLVVVAGRAQMRSGVPQNGLQQP
eukprot:ctg_1452.g342